MTTALPSAESRPALSSIRHYLELTKPRIAVMVLLTVIVGGILSVAAVDDFWLLVYSGLGVLLISASGSAWNQYLERYTDFMMPRTSRRPLPDYKLSAQQVAIFGAVTLGIGVAWLLSTVGWLTTLLGIGTWVLYVAIYTPLKIKTWWNTAVGAIAGAMPILIGSVAASESIPWRVWAFFIALFLWQFPHFMAIAWLYRRDYAAARLKMVTVVDPSGRLAGWHAVITAIALLVVTTAAAWLYPPTASRLVVAITSVAIGLWYLANSIQFFRHIDEPHARRLLRVSLLYLPILMIALVVAHMM